MLVVGTIVLSCLPRLVMLALPIGPEFSPGVKVGKMTFRLCTILRDKFSQFDLLASCSRAQRKYE